MSKDTGSLASKKSSRHALRTLCAAVPLFLILATLIVVPPVAIAAEATGATGATAPAAGPTGSSGASGPIRTTAPTGTPTITSDKPDYAPGELVTLTGTGWADGEVVHIVVNDTVGQTWKHMADVTAASDGTFIDAFNLPDYFVSKYDVTATGPISGTATTTFTDVSIGTYDQCANDTGTGYTTGSDLGCQWIGGNLTSGKGTYAEGDAVVERLWLTALSTGSHTITLKYGTTKGGKHAFDYLTTWNFSENWITNPDLCQDITIPGCTATGAGVDTEAIKDDPNTTTDNAGGQVFTMYNGNMTGTTIPVIVSGTYAGDSETVITITFSVDTATCAKPVGATTCDIALWFGAHVSTQLAPPVGWGIGNGASSISGSPYHVSLDALDGGAIGQRDNQMQAGAVPPNGTIVIVKDAVPNNAQDFSFNLTNGSTVNQSFSLDDDSDPTLPNTTSPQFSVPAGSYTATETMPLPQGWTLTNLVCVDPTNNTTVNVGTGVATINLASAETITCTYTDSFQKNSPTISTQVKTTGQNGAIGGGDDVNVADGATVAIGTEVYDTATLAGATANAGGTVAYRVAGPLTAAQAAALTCDASSGASLGGGAVSGSTVANSNEFTLTAAGIYEFWVIYSGDANNNSTTSTCRSETVVVQAPTGQITPTQTTCEMFNSGTAATLDTLEYSLKSGKINQVNPGVLFYWIKVTAVPGTNTFTITQDTLKTDNTQHSFDTYFGLANGSFVYTSNCVKVGSATINQVGANTNISFNGGTGGTFIIGVKYDPGTIKGKDAPSPATVKYKFEIATVPGSAQSLNLVKKT